MKRNPLYRDDSDLDRAQYEARRLYHLASSQMREILDALKLTSDASPKRLHARLDERLASIARLRDLALKADPDVDKRLCIASGTITLKGVTP